MGTGAARWRWRGPVDAPAMNTTPPIATIGPTIIMMTFSRPFFDFCSS